MLYVYFIFVDENWYLKLGKSTTLDVQFVQDKNMSWSKSYPVCLSQWNFDLKSIHTGRVLPVYFSGFILLCNVLCIIQRDLISNFVAVIGSNSLKALMYNKWVGGGHAIQYDSELSHTSGAKFRLNAGTKSQSQIHHGIKWLIIGFLYLKRWSWLNNILEDTHNVA